MHSGVLPIFLTLEMFVHLQRPRARGPATFAVPKRRLLPNSSVAEHAARPALTIKTVERVEASAQLAHLARQALANARTAD